MHAYYLFRRNDAGLAQITKHCGSLQCAKDMIESEVAVERYEEEADQVYAVHAGVRMFRIHCVPLRLS
jgi:hypothetical protein